MPGLSDGVAITSISSSELFSEEVIVITAGVWYVRGVGCFIVVVSGFRTFVLMRLVGVFVIGICVDCVSDDCPAGACPLSFVGESAGSLVFS